jgi:hypothetical protein
VGNFVLAGHNGVQVEGVSLFCEGFAQGRLGTSSHTVSLHRHRVRHRVCHSVVPCIGEDGHLTVESVACRAAVDGCGATGSGWDDPGLDAMGAGVGACADTVCAAAGGVAAKCRCGQHDLAKQLGGSRATVCAAAHWQ